jgi:hypothetical protein
MSRAEQSSTIYRAGTFVVGLLLVLVGLAMWLFSVLLTVPPIFAGLWVWSREFDWGHRLFHAFLRRARSLWSRVKQRPARWALMTVTGVAAGAAGYWLMAQYL